MRWIILSSVLVLFVFGIVEISDVFAEEKIGITIQPLDDFYRNGEFLSFNIVVDQYVPFSDVTCGVTDASSTSSGTVKENNLDMDWEIRQKIPQYYKDDKTDAIFRLYTNNDANVDTFKKWAEEYSGTHNITCTYLGASATTQYTIKDTINPAIEFVLKNHQVSQFDVGTNTIEFMKRTYWENYGGSFSYDFKIEYEIGSFAFNVFYSQQTVPESDRYVKILDNVPITQPYGDFQTLDCEVEYTSYDKGGICLTFNETIQKIRETGFPFGVGEQISININNESNITYDYSPTHVENFPDSTKSPQYYLDRYNNEEPYKQWFDTQFPNNTIHEILDVTEPEKPKIPNWVNNTMQWYLDGIISEDEMITAIQYLVKEGIIDIS